MHFTGTLDNGFVFEDSRRRKQPFKFVLGIGMVIEGWEEVLPRLTVGSRAKLRVPWQLGYGEQGRKNIPPRSDLFYDLELIAVKPGARVPPFPKGDPDKREILEGGIGVEVLKPSDEPPPPAGKALKIRFALWNTRGQLITCTELMRKHLTGPVGELRLGPQPEKFLQQVAPMLRPGAVYRFEVPPELCWGGEATHKRLPPHSDTVWELELVGTGEIPAFRKPDPSKAETTASGLVYEVIQEGGGKRPTADSRVRTHYTGWLIDGTRFDSSHARMAPAVFEVGKVIAGWQEALQLSREGSVFLVEIPPGLAYGKKGFGDRVPADATLVFLVELIEVLD